MSFAQQLTFSSIPAYIWWRARGRSHPVQLRLRRGPRFRLRPRSASDNDYGTAYEIFVYRFYDMPHSAKGIDVRLVVDLGANVGFSCLHWLGSYPDTQVIAFEPHPGHAAQCRANLALNGWHNRTVLHEAAAGTATGRMRLSDAGTSSRAVETGEDGFEVAVVDVLALLAGQKIGILKMDIEGGEYAILEDERFAALDIDAIVMEWHQRSTTHDDGAWCRQRLASLGYREQMIFDAGSHGMLWAFTRG
jgi:FkbM family methyltransferase